MTRKRHGTSERPVQSAPLRSIPKVPREFSEFGIEERTQVDVGVSTRNQRELIPSITGRTAKGSTPPPNVIPFTKPRAIAAVVAANPNALVIEASAEKALKNFDNTVLPPTPKPYREEKAADEPTTPFSMKEFPVTPTTPAKQIPAAASRVATGWTPPGAVPTAPAPGSQTLYSTPSKPVAGLDTRLPVQPIHIAAQASTVIALPPLHAPVPTAPPAKVAQQFTAPAAPAPAPAKAAPVVAQAPAVTAWQAPAPVQQTVAAWQPSSSYPVAAYPVVGNAAVKPAVAPAPQPVQNVFAQVTPIVMPAPVKPAPAPAVDRAPVSREPGSREKTDVTMADFMVMPEPASTTIAKDRWAVFEKLGLGKPKELLKTNPQKLIVNAYKLLGFVILTIIVVVLVGYIANSAFFYMSSSWVVPAQVSPTDEKVVTLQAQLAEQQNTRDRLADELNQAERSIAAQQQFQLEFAKAIKLDLDGRKAALGRVRELANNAAATRRAIKSQNSAYAGSARKRMALEYQAGLIDRNAMLSGGVQLAQLTSSNLTLAERQAEFETRAAELEATTQSLDAILSNVDGDAALSYEVLRIKQEYAASRLDLAKAIETRNTIKASLARQDKIVGSLKKSSYLRAVEDGAAVAFVPYGNLGGVEKGTDVYACKIGMVFCYHVGEVLEVLPGEVQFKHPQRDKMMRGQMVEMKLDEGDEDAAADDVLFIGGKPLFI